MTDLSLVFLIGLLGSAHCIGMCGGFVLAISQMHGRAASLQVHQALYYLGKTATYAVLGAVAGGLGAAFGSVVTGLQDVLSIALGVLLVGIGLGIVGVLRRFGGSGRLARLNVVASALSFFLRKRSHAGTFGLGLVNGLLPCGLVYGLLVKAAATGTVLGGALTMAVFGAATIPALYLLALTGFLMQPVWRARLNLVSGVLVILLGLVTIVRGTPAMEMLMGHDHAAQHEGARLPEADPHAGHAPHQH